MKETFKWPMKINAEGKTEFNTKKVQFDNGYEQNISVGRNNQRQSWNYIYSGDEQTITDIEAFVKRHNGIQSFYWTPPDGEQGEYITSGDISKTAHGGPDGKKLYTIAFEIRQVFGADTTDSTASAIISINGKSSPDGKITLSAADLSAEPAGTSSKAITALKQELDPFKQYLLKADVPNVPDIKPLEDQVTSLDTSLTSLTTTVAEIDEYTQEIHTELEGVSTQVFGLADNVNVNTNAITDLEASIAESQQAMDKLDKSQIKTINGTKPNAIGDVLVIADKPSDTTTYSGLKLKDLFEQADKKLQDAITELTKAVNSNTFPMFVALPFPSRNHIPSGFVAADGQDLSAATYPDAANAIKAGQVPLVTDEEWFADPTKRASYTLSSDSSRFRLPDYNGMHTDSLGALFFRGDNGQLANGTIQLDGIGNANIPITTSSQGVAHYINWFDSKTSLMAAPNFAGFGWNGMSDAGSANLLTRRVNKLNLGSSETRPLNANVCWAVKLFGEVINTGSANTEQLATDYANLAGRVSKAESKLQEKKFTIIYPNGGTVEKPANVEVNKRYEIANPFPNSPVICEAEILVNGIWGTTGWLFSGGGYGVYAGHILETDKIIIQTGSRVIMNLSSQMGGTLGYQGGDLVRAPCRVKVWRV